jgi:hypothetical protein
MDLVYSSSYPFSVDIKLPVLGNTVQHAIAGLSCSVCFVSQYHALDVIFICFFSYSSNLDFLFNFCIYICWRARSPAKKKKMSFKVQACLRSDIRKLEAESSFPANSIRGSRVGCQGRLLEGIPNSCQYLRKIPHYLDMAMLGFINF